MSERCKLFYFNFRSVSVVWSEMQLSKYQKQDAFTITVQRTDYYNAKLKQLTLSPLPPHYYSLIRPQTLWRLQMTGFLDLVPFSLLPIYLTTRCHSPEDTNLLCPHRYSIKSHTQNVAWINSVLRKRKLAFQCSVPLPHVPSYDVLWRKEWGLWISFEEKDASEWTVDHSRPSRDDVIKVLSIKYV